MKQKRPITAKHPPINLRKEKGKIGTNFVVFSRLKPCRINIDKETLFEENMALKVKNNALSEELTRLKTKISQVEKERNRKDDQQEFKPAHLVNKLKLTIKDLRTEIQQKNDEILKVRKNIKATRIAEVELEIQAYIDECTRLRHHLEEMLRQRDVPQITYPEPEEKGIQQDFLISNLKKENDGLNKAVLQSREEINKWRDRVLDLEKEKRQLLEFF